MLLDTTGVLQRLCKLYNTDTSERKMGSILISNIQLPCSDADLSGIIFLMMRLLNLPDIRLSMKFLDIWKYPKFSAYGYHFKLCSKLFKKM